MQTLLSSFAIFPREAIVSHNSQPTNPIFLSPLIRSQMFNNSSKNIKFNKWPLWLVEAKAKPGEVQFMEGRLNGNHATTP